MPKVLVMPITGDQGDTEEPLHSSYWLWCPACNEPVRITSAWDFNGDTDKPTFAPSIKTIVHEKVCHSFLTDGVWHYQADSTHEYAGQDLPAVEFPAIEGIDSTHV